MTSTEVTVDGVECVECEVEGVRVYLFGTAHVSKQSTLDAANLVRHLRPAVVFLELCPERSFLLKQDPNKPIASTPFSMAQVVASVKEGRMDAALQHIISGFYARVVKDLELDSFPGAEFTAAAQAGAEYGASVCLGDRRLSVTLKRTWASLTFFEKLKFFWSCLESLFLTVDEEMIEAMKSGIDALLEEFQQYFPNASRVLLDERNQVMATALNRTAHALALRWQQSASAAGMRAPPPPPPIVAVVGKGHVLEMASLIHQPVSDEAMCELSQPIPAFVRKRRTSRVYVITTTVAAAAAVGALAWWWTRRT